MNTRRTQRLLLALGPLSLCLAFGTASVNAQGQTAPFGPQPTPGQYSQGATREQAVQLLNQFLQALEERNHGSAIALLKLPPLADLNAVRQSLEGFLQNGEISHGGIGILTTRGKWGPLAQVVGQERADEIARRAEVPVEACYGFAFEEAEAAFHWDGRQFRIIRCNNVGQLSGTSEPPPPVQQNRAPQSACYFERRWEAAEAAFSILVPRGWTMEGGLFRVNPLEAGGPFNSMWPKVELTIKNDAAGTVLLQALPSYSYADFSAPGYEIQRQYFPPGSNFNGGIVQPMPGVREYLEAMFQRLHPQATNVRVIAFDALPELAEYVNKAHEQANQMIQLFGKPPWQATAGILIVEYEENQVRFKEAIMTAILDGRGPAAYWCNLETARLRAPAAEVARYQPLMDVMIRSVQINHQWLERQMAQLERNARILAEAAASIMEDRQQLWESRQRIMDRLDMDWMLYRTGQAEYRNPYTQRVEYDSNAWKHRWVTTLGDVIFTDDADYNPNADRGLGTREWQLTPATR